MPDNRPIPLTHDVSVCWIPQAEPFPGTGLVVLDLRPEFTSTGPVGPLVAWMRPDRTNTVRLIDAGTSILAACQRVGWLALVVGSDPKEDGDLVLGMAVAHVMRSRGATRQQVMVQFSQQLADTPELVEKLNQSEEALTQYEQYLTGGWHGLARLTPSPRVQPPVLPQVPMLATMNAPSAAVVPTPPAPLQPSTVPVPVPQPAPVPTPVPQPIPPVGPGGTPAVPQPVPQQPAPQPAPVQPQDPSQPQRSSRVPAPESFPQVPPPMVTLTTTKKV